ncbi:OmpH family outer membrane protein [Haloferula sp. A504]|uniref:OmpH family outer membrane protein n=1 Tax=Haloferula sp. A504 TaxID=3373601 RepID=UPI0031C419E8|nr:OmpH family outer membrane protein [Verrucomicrobiaceae bacterium E54]
MRQRHTIVLLWLLATGLSLASPKIALVRVGDIYRALPASQTLESSIEAERAAILTNARADAYRSVLKELDELRQGIAKIPKDDRATRERAQQNFALKRQEALTLQREFVSYRQRKNDEINTRMVAEMEKILADIRAAATEVGNSLGYDWVLDSDGRTNTGLPFVLYSKDPSDITDNVLAALGGPVATVGEAESN